jgi:hypothetical protein
VPDGEGSRSGTTVSDGVPVLECVCDASSDGVSVNGVVIENTGSVYKPVTPMLDDEAHVLEAPGIKYDPEGPK